jgi:hypothetical protein
MNETDETMTEPTTDPRMAAANGHVLTLETLVAMDAAILQSYDDDPWPWPPYGVSERDDPEWIRADDRHPADAATTGEE